MATQHAFDYMAKQRAVLLTSYRRDGTPVDTAVNLVVEGDHAFMRTYDRAWKAKRMARNLHVKVAPSTMSGKPTGPAIDAGARLLQGEEARHAAAVIERKHRILQGVMVPLFHKLRGYRTLHYELHAA